MYSNVIHASNYSALKDVIEKAKGISIKSDSEEESDNEMERVAMEEDPREKWDCESILSECSL